MTLCIRTLVSSAAAPAAEATDEGSSADLAGAAVFVLVCGEAAGWGCGFE